MKHPASAAAIVFLGLAFVIGGATWLLAGPDVDDGPAAQLPAAQVSESGFVAITPREQRKKAEVERIQRELQRIKEIGEEVGPDMYMIPDANGEPTYYSTKLAKGVGRNGEPVYVQSYLKKRPMGPLIDGKKLRVPEAPKFKKKPLNGVLKGGKPADKDGDGQADGAPALEPSSGSALGGQSGQDG